MGNQHEIMLRCVVVEKILLKRDPLSYTKIVQDLGQKYGLDMCECYWNTKCLISVIKDVCKDSYIEVLEEIKAELNKYGHDLSYEEYLIPEQYG